MTDDTRPPFPLFIVMNAGSGRRDSQQTLALMREKFLSAGRDFELYLIDQPEKLQAVATQAAHDAAAHKGALIGVGGDGTLNAVAQQAYAVNCPFGALPQGTFNYFGRTHHIPEDAAAAIDALLHAQPQPVQIGEVNGHLFLVNASLGLYPRLLQEREAYKQRFGRSRLVAFLASILTFAHDHRALSLQIELDGVTRTLFTSTLFVGNNALQLEQVGIDEAEQVPGQLAAIVVHPGGKLKMLGLLLRGAIGTLGASEQIESFTFSQLTVQPRQQSKSRRVKVAIDGEILRLDTPLQFAIAQRPLYLLLPDKPPTV